MFLAADTNDTAGPVPGFGDGVLRRAGQELIVGQDHVAGPQPVIDRDCGRFRAHFDIRQAGGVAGLVVALRHHGENNLTVKIDGALGQNGIAAKGRAAFVRSRNILCRQHRRHTGGGPHRIQIKFADPALGAIWGVARRHVQQISRFGYIVDIAGIALDLPGGAVVGQGVAHCVIDVGGGDMGSPRLCVRHPSTPAPVQPAVRSPAWRRWTRHPLHAWP